MKRSVCSNGELRIVEHDGFIMVVGIGFWNETVLDEHFSTLRNLIARQRLLTPTVCGLIDLRASAVQRPSMIENIRANAHNIWSREDRVALVVSSQLGKLQMDRVARDHSFRIFDSIAEALSWLETQKKPARPIPLAASARPATITVNL